MRKFAWIAIVLFVLAVDWAALHDIFLGQEPSYTQEWTWLALSTVVLAGAAWFWLSRRGRGRTGSERRT